MQGIRGPDGRACHPLPVTWIDWLIVVFTGLLTVYGYLQGFIVGALSLAGFAAGAFLGTRVGPLLLPGGAHSPDAPLFGLVGALLAGGVLASGFEGLGAHARSALRLPGLRTIDGLAGAALTACVGLGVAWIVGSVALQSAGSLTLRRDIQRSVILRDLNSVLPPSGSILNALARFDPLPSVRGPQADVAPPARGVLAVPAIRAGFGSVVRVLGSACGLGIEGSGWVAAPGIVVTNAHVVAGETDTTVQARGHPPSLPAQLVDFDPHDDIAVLRVPGLPGKPLRMASGARSGAEGALLGFPLDGSFDAEPVRTGDTQPVSTQDAYGNGPVVREILALRGRVRPGNSGGPIVGRDGAVLGTVFAAVTGGAAGDGFAVPNRLVARALAAVRTRHGAPVSTGQCAG
jgi:S1-C subfamily serine protease